MSLINGQIKINNKDYLVRFDINTLCDMKQKAGVDVMRLDPETFDFVLLRSLFFYGLQQFHSKEVIDESVAGSLLSDYLINEGTLEEFSDVLISAVNTSLGIREAVEKK